MLDRPGGERAIMEGKSSLGRGEWKGGKDSFACMWFCSGGSSKVRLNAGCLGLRLSTLSWAGRTNVSM